MTRAEGGAARTLSAVLSDAFDAREDDEFARRICGLVSALLDTRPVDVFAAPAPAEGAEPGAPVDAPVHLAGTGRDAPPDEAAQAARACLSAEGDGPAVADGWLTLRLPRPAGGACALVCAPPRGPQVAQALAMERLTLLGALARARLEHPDLGRLRAAVVAASALSDPTVEAMRGVADAICAVTRADWVALGRWDGAAVADVTVSGQGRPVARAALPDALRGAMRETARARLWQPDRALMAARGRPGGLVLHVEGARRDAALVPLIAAAGQAALPAGAAPRGLARRLRAAAVTALVLIGVAAVPLPDGVELPATVQADEFRIVTAPYAASVARIEVTDAQPVAGGRTVLAAMDATETVADLIAARAEYAAALLAREGARAGRDAAALRAAELEAQRIEARIDLLEIRRASAELVAPIDGLVIAPGLEGRQGAVLRQGETLMEIADPATLRLELAVPQAALSRLRPGLEGRFRPDFDPALIFDAALTSVSPAALDADRDPVFAARARLAGDTGALRHGMTGVLVVDRTWRPVGLTAWDALRDWALLRFWI
ncbi:MAG: efflux RND transporter periplasmic adaptor subunit [Paracoccaceae bacterium]